MAEDAFIVLSIEYGFPFQKHLTALGSPSHGGRNILLSGVMFQSVENIRKEIVIRRRDFIHQNRCQNGMIQQPTHVEHIDQPDTRHHGSAVRNS